MIEKIKEIVNLCHLNRDDIKFIIRNERVRNTKDLYYTLEYMLINNQIKVEGNKWVYTQLAKN